MIEDIIEFNYSPAVYVDASWLSDAIDTPEFFKELQASSAAQPWLSRFVLRQLALENSFDFDFNDHLKQVALLDKKRLIPVIFHTGICLNGYWIRNIIRRDERNLIINCLGQDGYRYATKRSPYICGDLGRSFPTQFKTDQSTPEELRKHIFRSGLRLVGQVFSRETKAFRNRFLLKFPAASKKFFEAHTVDEKGSFFKDSRTTFGKLLKDFL